MNTNSYIFFFCLLGYILSLSSNARSQDLEESLRPALNYLLDTLVDQGEAINVRVEAIAEQLTFYLLNPIDLNACTYSDLEKLPLLDAYTAKIIIDHREEAGGFRQLVELQRIPSLSPILVDLLSPFLFVSGNGSNTQGNSTSLRLLQPVRKTIISQSIGRQIEETAGFSRTPADGGYYGNPFSLLTRVVSESARGVTFRLTLEKDPGEAIKWAPRKNLFGPDHITSSFSINSSSLFKQLIAGDYITHFGQGLLFSSTFRSGKGSRPTRDPLRPIYRVRSIASRSENSNFRGIAGHFSLLESTQAFLFFSRRKLDATLLPDEEHSPHSIGVSALQTSGLHRTNSEIRRKNQLGETLYGYAFVFSTPSLNLGQTAYTTTYEYPFLLQNPGLSRFSGDKIRGWSLFGDIHINTVKASWELAKSTPGSYAFVSSLLLRPHSSISLLFLWRKYSDRYFSFYGKGFGERSSRTKNETGLYLGSDVSLTSTLNAALFFDFYEFPKIEPGLSTHSTRGVEGFFKLDYSPRKWLHAYIQYKFELKPERSSERIHPHQELYSTIPNETNGYKIRFEYIHSDALRLRTHVEIKEKTLPSEKSRGFLLYQDVIYQPIRHTKIYFRFSIFDSNRNDIILYAFENDLQYQFGIRSFSGEGIRNFFLLKHLMFKKVLLEVKYAETLFRKNTIKGSGNSSITSSQIRELSGQISLRI